MLPLQKVGLILVAALCVVIFLKYTAVNYTTTITTNDYSNLPRQFYKKNLLTDLPKDLNHTDSPHHTNITLSHPPSQLNASNNINSTDATTVTTDGSQVTSYTSFNQTFHDFPWDGFEIAVTKNLSLEIISYSEALIDKLTYFLTLEPLVPVNEQCLPPPLPSVDEIDCTLYPKAFTGVKRTEPIKIGVLIQFGFDVDVLEIHMNELYDVVDKFFIIESTHAHYGKLEKPLIWEQVKGQKRFRKFPVVHFIIDDAEATEATDKQWAMESLQERRRWEKFSEWNAATKYFSDDDVIGFGDADEIPNRSRLHLFKFCAIQERSVDFGIWFPFGHISQAFRSDYPVPGHPLTLGDPTFYTLGSAKKPLPGKMNEIPSRKRGRSGHFMLGGIHMTHYGYLPFQIVKEVTASEGGLRSLSKLQNFTKYLKTGDIVTMEKSLGATPTVHKRKIVAVNLNNPEMKEICMLPWFYDCNRNRYPVWEDGHDTRLD